MKLIKYNLGVTRFFGDGEYETIYELTLLHVWFFNIIREQKKVTYRISMFQSIKEHTDHWDELIRTGAKIKL